MKKIKRKPSRLHRALRAAAVMLCAAVLYLFLADAKLTPMMAVHMLEEFHGIYEETHVVASCGTQAGRRYYLMAGENALLCAEVDRHGLFWQDTNGTVLDCSDGERIHAGWWDMARNGVRDIFYWGRVDDAAVDSAVIERYRAVSQDENGDYTFEKREAFAAELIEDGDYRYFLTGGVATEANYGDYGWDRVYFVGYDASGAEVLRYEIERQMSTSFA